MKHSNSAFGMEADEEALWQIFLSLRKLATVDMPKV